MWDREKHSGNETFCGSSAWISIKSAQWADIYMREFWQVKDCQNPIVSVLFTTFSDFFRMIKLYNLLSL